jgi:glycerophosphoryl diester phosphodiesterase
MPQNKTCVFTAHAGALNTEPNTLPSVQAGLAAPRVANIEVDLRFAPNGEPALHHNAIAEGEVYCTLEACFAAMRGTGRGINLDLKDPTGNLTRVKELVDAYELGESAFFTGIGANSVHFVKDLGIPYYLNCTPRLFSSNINTGIIAQAKQLGAVGLNFQYLLCSKKLVQAAHAAGLLVSVWTVGSHSAAKRLLAFGVDNITSRSANVLALAKK